MRKRFLLLQEKASLSKVSFFSLLQLTCPSLTYALDTGAVWSVAQIARLTKTLSILISSFVNLEFLQHSKIFNPGRFQHLYSTEPATLVMPPSLYLKAFLTFLPPSSRLNRSSLLHLPWDRSLQARRTNLKRANLRNVPFVVKL